MPLSRSAQMRAARARGMSTGDIARLFGVSYHHAYAVVVTHAGAAPGRAPGSSSLPTDGSGYAGPVYGETSNLQDLDTELLFSILEKRGGGKLGSKERLQAAKTLDDRYGDYNPVFEFWKEHGRLPTAKEVTRNPSLGSDAERAALHVA